VRVGVIDVSGRHLAAPPNCEGRPLRSPRAGAGDHGTIESMLVRTRVWSLGKGLLLLGALLATYLASAAVAMRVTVRAGEVRVPAVVGRSVTDASHMLAEVGLGIRVDSSRRPDEKIVAGGIIQQEPAADTQVRRQRTIRVWLSSGPRTTSVPALVGQSARTAQFRIAQEGLEVGTITEFRSTEYGTDAVVAQNPLPTSNAPQVSLLVSRSDRAVVYVMPDLVGTDGEEAAETLRALGLRSPNLVDAPHPGVPPGTVVRQQPAAGYPVEVSDPITFEVSQRAAVEAIPPAGVAGTQPTGAEATP